MLQEQVEELIMKERKKMIQKAETEKWEGKNMWTLCKFL